uniref:Uncharacterized protein n=1 Tax=Janibacter limosus TaxID=53458 RepID=A0AC61U6S7_9MICO|nr:hypothetical protein [Janibacter limosus]
MARLPRLTSAPVLAGALVVLTMLAAGPLRPYDQMFRGYWAKRYTPDWWLFLDTVPNAIAGQAVCLPILAAVAIFIARRHRTWHPLAVVVAAEIGFYAGIGGLKVLLGRTAPAVGEGSFPEGGLFSLRLVRDGLPLRSHGRGGAHLRRRGLPAAVLHRSRHAPAPSADLGSWPSSRSTRSSSPSTSGTTGRPTSSPGSSPAARCCGASSTSTVPSPDAACPLGGAIACRSARAPSRSPPATPTVPSRCRSPPRSGCGPTPSTCRSRP